MFRYLQDYEQYSGDVDENKSLASILQLQGKAKEAGIYECRWNNSRGEARHRNFTVTVDFVDVDEKKRNTIIIPLILIGILAVGMGIGIKFYLEKVRNEMNRLITD